jgi:CubicO group peptidase (beta-lactamase class C family)
MSGGAFAGNYCLSFGRQKNNDDARDPIGKKLEVLIPHLLSEFSVSGLQIALIQDGRMSWSQGFGVKETATRKPVTQNTVFESASLSKPTFAYAALKLIDKGILELDSPLSRYLPDPFIPNEPRLPSINVRMILSHTSGIPFSRKGNEPLRLLFEPGKRFQYSATGFDYLQKVIYQNTQQPLERFMKEEVLDPFAMSNSNFGWQERFDSQRALAYNLKGEQGQTFNEKYRTASTQWREAIAKSNPELSYPSAAAGMYGTAEDFARFLIEMVKPRIGASAHLSEKLLKEMLSPQIKITNEVSWGLGWGILHTKNDDAFWHWGNWSGLYQHFAAILRNERAGVVILTNSGNGLNLCKKLVPVAIGLDIKPTYRFFD